MTSPVVASVLILLGALLSLIAAVGLFRLPDVFGRMHAATKPAVLGLIMLLVGVAVQLSDLGATTRLLVAAGLQLVTAPVAMHVVGRAVERVVEVRREDAGGAGTSEVPADGGAPGEGATTTPS